ncbi:MAG TPA: FG-GAP repeat protein, partial [Phototrophicaceae bacterium]|nr:FG-GAP repeat protein [Phototrophicaceae bacterium]
PGIFDAGAVYYFRRSGSIWTEQGTALIASDASTAAHFGLAVSMSNDGSDALITTPEGQCCTFRGKAYSFTRSGNVWSQGVSFQSSDIEDNDRFGTDSALSGDGSTAIVGVVLDDNIIGPDAGAVYIFNHNGANWDQQTKLIAPYYPEEGERGDNLGETVTISADGNTALILMHDFDASGKPIVAVRVYVRSGETWSLQQILTKPDSVNGSPFGNFMALSADGNTALIGVYVFVRNGGVWSLQQNFGFLGESFSGAELSADGNTAVVSESSFDFGSVFVYTRTGNTWDNGVFVGSDDAELDDGYAASISLSADGNFLMVSGVFQSVNGAVYVFARNGNAWEQKIKLIQTNTALNYFGCWVELNADATTAAIGAFDFTAEGFGNQGVVFILNRSGEIWTQETYLSGFGGYQSLPFDISDDGNMLLIGRPNLIPPTNFPEDPGPSSAYLFKREGAEWNQQAEIMPADEASYDWFASSVAMSGDGNTLLMGAPGDDTDTQNVTDSYNNHGGAAYIFFEDGTIPTETPTGTPTATPTPTATLDVTATATSTDEPTATPEGFNELLSNGGFELDTDNNKVPDDWKQKNPTNDKRKCPASALSLNLAERAVVGGCFYQFKSGANENSKLEQIVDLDTVDL